MSEAETALEQDLKALESESAPTEPVETPDDVNLEEAEEQVESPDLDPQEAEPADLGQEEPESKQARDKRIAGYYAERARAEQLAAEKSELERQLQQKQQPAAQAPNYDDYDTDAEYYAAMAEHVAEQKIQAFRQEQQQSGYQSERIKAQQEFARRVAAANIPNYEEKAELIASTVGVRQDTLEALWTLDNGPQVVAYLADHLDIADGISPVELGKLSAKMAAPKPIQKSKAPPVVKPVKSSGTTGKSFDDPDAEFSDEEVRAFVMGID